MMNTFRAMTRLKWILRSSRSVVLNRLDEPDAMGQQELLKPPNMASNTCLVITQLRERFGSSRSVIPNRLDEPDAMAPTAPSEKVNEGIEHVLGHNSAQRTIQEVSWGDSESSWRDVSNDGIESFALEN